MVRQAWPQHPDAGTCCDGISKRRQPQYASGRCQRVGHRPVWRDNGHIAMPPHPPTGSRVDDVSTTSHVLLARARCRNTAVGEYKWSRASGHSNRPARLPRGRGTNRQVAADIHQYRLDAVTANRRDGRIGREPFADPTKVQPRHRCAKSHRAGTDLHASGRRSNIPNHVGPLDRYVPMIASTTPRSGHSPAGRIKGAAGQ